VRVPSPPHAPSLRTRPPLRTRRDHGDVAHGGWQNKSENPGPADQAHRLIICEWTADL